MGLVPVARYGGDRDHQRSAFGRYVAEAVFWTPAALLPGEHVRWEAIDDSSARVILAHRGLEQAVDVTVDANGQPVKVNGFGLILEELFIQADALDTFDEAARKKLSETIT